MALTILKVIGAAACAVAIGWLMWIQQRYTLARRLGIAALAAVLLLPAFALTVSVRCDLGNLPDDECDLGAP